LFFNSTVSSNQILHREYLQSPVWKAKRQLALDHYGPICNRCREYGNDVHHRTYVRVGGDELLEDLEVLCRECHTAHHDLEKRQKLTEKIGTSRRIQKRAIFSSLTKRQKKILMESNSISRESELYTKLSYGSDESLLRSALKLLDCDSYIDGQKPSGGYNKPRAKSRWQSL